jgi:hypothetical protein
VRQVLVVMLIAACGRFDFDGRAIDAAGSTNNADANADTASADSGSACAYAICDGFEAAQLDPIWAATSGVTLDDTVANRGSQSLHVHTDAIAAHDGVDLGIAETTTFGTGFGTLWIRMYARVGAIPVNHLGIIEAIQGSDDNPDTDGLFLTNAGIVVYSQFTNTSDVTMSLPTIDAWTCYVFEIVRADDSTGSLALTGDFSAELDDVQTDGTPPLSALGFGLAFADSTDAVMEPAYDIWIDDVIVANTPVTCAD